MTRDPDGWDDMSDRQRDNVRRRRHTDFMTCARVLGECDECMAFVGMRSYRG